MDTKVYPLRQLYSAIVLYGYLSYTSRIGSPKDFKGKSKKRRIKKQEYGKEKIIHKHSHNRASHR